MSDQLNNLYKYITEQVNNNKSKNNLYNEVLDKKPNNSYVGSVLGSALNYTEGFADKAIGAGERVLGYDEKAKNNINLGNQLEQLGDWETSGHFGASTLGSIAGFSGATVAAVGAGAIAISALPEEITMGSALATEGVGNYIEGNKVLSGITNAYKNLTPLTKGIITSTATGFGTGLIDSQYVNNDNTISTSIPEAIQSGVMNGIGLHLGLHLGKKALGKTFSYIGNAKYGKVSGDNFKGKDTNIEDNNIENNNIEDNNIENNEVSSDSVEDNILNNSQDNINIKKEPTTEPEEQSIEELKAEIENDPVDKEELDLNPDNDDVIEDYLSENEDHKDDELNLIQDRYNSLDNFLSQNFNNYVKKGKYSIDNLDEYKQYYENKNKYWGRIKVNLFDKIQNIKDEATAEERYYLDKLHPTPHPSGYFYSMNFDIANLDSEKMNKIFNSNSKLSKELTKVYNTNLESYNTDINLNKVKKAYNSVNRWFNPDVDKTIDSKVIQETLDEFKEDFTKELGNKLRFQLKLDNKGADIKDVIYCLIMEGLK